MYLLVAVVMSRVQWVLPASDGNKGFETQISALDDCNDDENSKLET